MLTIPVLLIVIACTTLFKEIPNEEAVYPIFQPPFDVLKKYIDDPRNTGEVNCA